MDDTSRFAAEHISVRSTDVLSYVTGTVQTAVPDPQSDSEEQ